MPKYRTELFGQVIYAAEISYDELLKLESEFKDFITESLEAAGGEFPDFESEGDRTFFQCVFQSCGSETMEGLAETFKARMNKNLESKLMFVDKMLCRHVFYGINHKKIQEKSVALPEAGPIDKSLNEGDA